MNKKNISPNPQQPVDRVPTGQLPSALAELSEEAIGEQVLSPATAKELANQFIGFGNSRVVHVRVPTMGTTSSRGWFCHNPFRSSNFS